MTSTNVETDWDRAYEIKAVTLLSLGFGLVGLDRFMILPMFPNIAKDLHLSYSNLGEITGALAVAWGCAALFSGRISDLFGRRKVVLVAVIVFSLLVGASGLATSLVTMVALRAVMGLADGAYNTPSIIATLEASKPTRHGRNMGIQLMCGPLFGLALAPLIVTQLLQTINWRWIFLLVSPLGLILALALFFVLRAPSELAPVEHTAVHDTSHNRLIDVLRFSNIRHNMIGMLCWLSCLVVTSAMLPSYLVDYLHLTLQQMGFVLSAIGFGSTAGSVVMPMISDRVGRKPIMLICTLGGALALLSFMYIGTAPVALFTVLLVVNFFNFALITLTVGPISAESVPAALMASASGLVIFTGEVFGGGIAPILVGSIAQAYGIQYILHFGVAALLIGFVNSCFLKETAPIRLRHVNRDASLTAMLATAKIE